MATGVWKSDPAISDPTTTQGDLIVRGATDLERFAAGAGNEGKVLAVVAGVPAWSASAGTGDTSTDTATSVDAEIALFKSTTGKLLKRATVTGLLKATSGVLSAATAGVDYAEPDATPTFDTALVGAAANFTDYPEAVVVVAQDSTGHTHTGKLGITGEAVSDGALVATGVGGNAKSSGAFDGRGVVGVGKAGASADTASCIGVFGRSVDTHAGGPNIGVYSNAANGDTNYSFYGVAGLAHNVDSIGSDANVTAGVDVVAGAKVVAGTNVEAAALVKGATGQFGDVADGDYSEFEADGTLKFNGAATVWRDLIFSALNLRPGTSNSPGFAQIGTSTIYGFRFDAGSTSILYGTVELQHDYKEGTDLYVHFHWTPTTTNAGNITWGFDYAIANVNDTFPATTVATKTEAAPGTIDKHTLTSIVQISGTGLKIGAVLRFRAYRPNTDAFTGNAFLDSIGIHYECDTVGSRAISTK